MKKVMVSLTIMLALACVWQLGLLSVQSEVLAEVQSESPGIAVDQVPVSSSLVMQKMNLHPLAFTENQGQWDDRVLFRANAGGATIRDRSATYPTDHPNTSSPSSTHDIF